MTDKELADRVMALGVGSKIFNIGLGQVQPMTLEEASKFVRDWRVAGALMKKCYTDHVCLSDIAGHSVLIHHLRKEPLSRTFVEVCIEALGEKK